jgi:hypothetical protein
MMLNHHYGKKSQIGTILKKINKEKEFDNPVYFLLSKIEIITSLINIKTPMIFKPIPIIVLLKELILTWLF